MLNKLVNKFGDKTVHVWMGILISVISGMLFYIFIETNIFVYPLVGFLIGIVMGALKEVVYDSLLDKGSATIMDFLATLYGSLIGAILVIMTIGTIEKLGQS